MYGRVRDIDPQGLAIGLIIIFVFSFFIKKESVFVCKNKYSFCKLNSVNIYNIPSSKYVFIADDILGTNIQKYTVRKGGRYSHTYETKYKIIVNDKTGKGKEIFRGYSYSGNAQNKANEIMDCLKKENYPCEFQR